MTGTMTRNLGTCALCDTTEMELIDGCCEWCDRATNPAPPHPDAPQQPLVVIESGAETLDAVADIPTGVWVNPEAKQLSKLPDGSLVSAADCVRWMKAQYARPEFTDGAGGCYRDPVSGNLAMPPEFADSQPRLRQAWDTALQQRRSPESALFGCVTRGILATPPQVKLPGYVQGPASLNTWVVVAGPTGAGKSGSLNLMDRMMDVANEITATRVAIGSPQGLVSKYLGPDPEDPKKQVQVLTAAEYVCAEIDDFSNRADMPGSIMTARFRSMISCETVGSANATAERSRQLNDHNYRTTIVMAGQSSRMHKLICKEEIAGGTTGRIIWCSASGTQPPRYDPCAPEPDFSGDCSLGWTRRTEGGCHLKFPDTAKIQIRLWDQLNQDGALAQIDGHRMLNRMKLAAGLALLRDSNTREVPLCDWNMSGLMMDYSDAVRSEVMAAVAAVKSEDNAVRAKMKANEAVQINRAVNASQSEEATSQFDADVQKIGEKLWTRDDDGPHSANKMFHPVRSVRQRVSADSPERVRILDEIVARGWALESVMELGRHNVETAVWSKGPTSPFEGAE